MISNLLLLSGQLFALVAVAAWLSAVASAAPNLLEPEVAYEQVFATGDYYPELAPLQTRELLKLLAKWGPADPEQIGELLEVCDHLEPAKCDLDSFLVPSALIEDTPKDQKNVLAYLRYCRSERFAVCQQTLANDLETAIKQLTQEDKDDMVALKESILANMPSNGPADRVLQLYHHIPLTNLAHGILEFLDLPSGPIDVEKAMRERNAEFHILEELEQDVVRFCQRVRAALNPLMEIYDLLMVSDEELVEKLDRHTLDWVANNRICYEILSNAQSA